MQKGPIDLGGAVRNMALGAFTQTVCHLVGTVGGSFGLPISEHWASSSLADFFHVHKIYRRALPVRMSEYLGKWAGWWLFLAILWLPVRLRFVTFINSTAPPQRPT